MFSANLQSPIQPASRPFSPGGAANDPVNMRSLLERTNGIPEVRVAVIDGPIAPHPDLAGATRESILSEDIACKVANSQACRHGTFVLGMLAAAAHAAIPGLCPDCTFLIRPIFCEPVDDRACPILRSADLARALEDALRADAHIINLSMGLASRTMQPNPELDAQIEEARRRGAIVVAASGNHGRVGHLPLFKHPWTIPVVAAGRYDAPIPGANTGISVGRRGLMAPGTNIRGLDSTGSHTSMDGTSFAAPYVTAAAALLRSIFPNRPAEAIRAALLNSAGPRRSIIPPMLNASGAMELLDAGN